MSDRVITFLYLSVATITKVRFVSAAAHSQIRKFSGALNLNSKQNESGVFP